MTKKSTGGGDCRVTEIIGTSTTSCEDAARPARGRSRGARQEDRERQGGRVPRACDAVVQVRKLIRIAPLAALALLATLAACGRHDVGDDPWRGLERHEIQLEQKLLVVRGTKGIVGCPYLDVRTFDRLGQAFAVVPAKDTAAMLDAIVTAVTSKASEIGIQVGMTGREALDRIR